MGLTIRKLNGDTTFLLTLENVGSSRFTILIDPWLSGESTWLHPAFQWSNHTVPSELESLAQLTDEIDIILISQDKPDHCHKETLCSWPKDKPVDILATTTAARKIRDWKHFPAEAVQELRIYNAVDPSTLYQSSLSTSDVLTIANIASKKDLTGLHNAIGITLSSCTVAARRDSHLNPSQTHTPPHTPTEDKSSTTSSRKSILTRVKSFGSLRLSSQQQTPATTPPLPATNTVCHSCIYTPHGLSTALLEPYVQHHLRPSGALPLTVLIHSLVKERNPWYMGGTVAAGAPGAVEIADALGGRIRTWISAHDEAKDNRGLSVKLLKTERYECNEASDLLSSLGYGHIDVQCPNPGEEIRLTG